MSLHYREIAKDYLSAIALKIKLGLKRTRRAVAFDLPSLGEFQFFEPVLSSYSLRNPHDIIIIVHNGTAETDFDSCAPALKDRVHHVRRHALNRLAFPEIDFFLTTEQYDLGLDQVYSACMFHGHAAKGLSFVPSVVNTFDAFFSLGPVHKEAFQDFVNDFLDGVAPSHLQIFEIGYPKSDALLRGHYDRTETLTHLSLDTDRPTILYAPAFNEGASLRECGLEIIKTLSSEHGHNVIVKLPIDCWQPTSNFYATGGVDWFAEIGKMESIWPNLRLVSEYLIDPLLVASDVLVTCISSVSFEFLALNKPVIFVDTPKYFSGYLQKQFPDKNTTSWAKRTTANAGKEFGLVVSSVDELPAAIQTVLRSPGQFPLQQERLKSYLLFNPGRGTQAAVEKIEELVSKRVTTMRPSATGSSITLFVFSQAARLVASFARRIGRIANEWFDHVLAKRGYRILRTGSGYISPSSTIKASRAAGLSICDFLEGRESDPRKKGRRDRIVESFKARGLLGPCERIVEIGAGTGMYLEKVASEARPESYEVYETNPGWRGFLKEEYSGRGYDLVLHPADGESLKGTPSSSCQLVHAHAVFVYVPLLQILNYVRESARVLKLGGKLVFDCYLDSFFDRRHVEAWLAGPWRFPVIISERLLMEFCASCGFVLEGRFMEVHGSSSSEYLVFRRDDPRNEPKVS